MKRINVEQGSKEWLRWRKTVITATDCPAIMGSSPYVTPYKCWQRKLDLVQEQSSNAAMERGRRLEPEARELFNKTYGFEMNPAVIESSEFQFLGASLDGITTLGNYIIEIKCGGVKLHDMARNGEIPEHYMDQMQHQLLVTRAEKCFYYSYNGHEGICIEIKPDPEFINYFMPKAYAFWKGIATFEAPALTIRDYKNMNDNRSWNEYADMYQKVDKDIKAQEEKKDYIRKKLIELCENESSQGHGLKVMKIISKGRVNYEEIPEIQGIDLNKYRKESNSSWKFLVENM